MADHKHASPSDYYRQDSLTAHRCAQIQEGAKRLPLAEATQIAAMTGSPPVDDLETLKLRLVFNRFANRLCNRCYAGKHVVDKKLKLCTGCYSTWYCGQDCQLADRPVHREWCNKPDASPDKGPLRVAMVRLSDAATTSTSAPGAS